MIIQMLTIGDTETNLGIMLGDDSEQVVLDLSTVDDDYEYGATIYDYKYNTLYALRDLLGVTFTKTDLLKDHNTVKLLSRYKVLPSIVNGPVENYKEELKDDGIEYLSKTIDADIYIPKNNSIHFTELLLLSYIAKRNLKQKMNIEIFIIEDEDGYSRDEGFVTIEYNSSSDRCNVIIEHVEYIKNTRIVTEVTTDVADELIKELMSIEDERDRNKRFLKYLSDYLVDKKISLCVD